MIPTILTMSKSGVSTMGIDQPEGGTTGNWYLLFDDPTSTVTSFDVRYRQRTRLLSSDVVGAWGEWSTYTETIALSNYAGYVGVRQSTHAFAFTGLSNTTGGYDYLELELQVREAGGTWSASNVAKVRLKPTIAVTFSQTATNSFSLAVTGDWTRNNNRIGINRIYAGSTSGAIILSGWKYVGSVPADGAISVPSDWFKTVPGRGQTIVVTGEYTTCDGAKVTFSQSTSVTWVYCNTPVIALDPDDTNGRLGVTVIDAGDKSQTITSCTVSIVGGYSIPVTIGTKAWYPVPPLDVDVTVIAQAASASGAMAQATATSKVNAKGICWFNFGDDSLAMIYNRDRSIDSSGKREYFEVDSGTRKVFYGAALNKTITEKGALLVTDSAVSDVEALSEYAGDVYYRVPAGEIRKVSIDSVAISQASPKYYNATIQMTEVQ